MLMDGSMFGKDEKLLYNYIYVKDGHDTSRMIRYEKTMKELIYDPVLEDLKGNKEVVKLCRQIFKNKSALFNIQEVKEFCDMYSYESGYDDEGYEESSIGYEYNQNKFDERYYRYQNVETLNENLLNQIDLYKQQLEAYKNQIYSYETEKSDYLEKSINPLKKFKAKRKYDALISKSKNEMSNVENIIADLNSQINSNNENYELMTDVLKKQKDFENTWYKNGEFVDINKPLQEKVNEMANRYIRRRLPELLEKYPELLNYNYKDNPSLAETVEGCKVDLNLGQIIQSYSDLVQQKGLEEANKLFCKDRDEKFMKQLAKEEKEREEKHKKMDAEKHEVLDNDVIYE